MITIAVANQKGGVGKTTSAVNLATAMAAMGWRTLLVDLDPQGNASTGLGVNAEDRGNSSYELLVDGISIEECVVATAIPNLFPILGTEAWLWTTGQGLQLSTVLSLTIAFGIAVDDTTHFLSHYLHARREEGKDHHEAVRFTMDRIGGAIVATTLILCSGTAIVMFSALP